MWEARTLVGDASVAIAQGKGDDVKGLAAAEMERRNIPDCRLWELVDGGWKDIGERLRNFKYDPHAPIRN